MYFCKHKNKYTTKSYSKIIVLFGDITKIKNTRE